MLRIQSTWLIGNQRVGYSERPRKPPHLCGGVSAYAIQSTRFHFSFLGFANPQGEEVDTSAWVKRIDDKKVRIEPPT